MFRRFFRLYENPSWILHNIKYIRNSSAIQTEIDRVMHMYNNVDVIGSVLASVYYECLTSSSFLSV